MFELTYWPDSFIFKLNVVHCCAQTQSNHKWWIQNNTALLTHYFKIRKHLCVYRSQQLVLLRNRMECRKLAISVKQVRITLLKFSQLRRKHNICFELIKFQSDVIDEEIDSFRYLMRLCKPTKIIWFLIWIRCNIGYTNITCIQSN